MKNNTFNIICLAFALFISTALSAEGKHPVSGSKPLNAGNTLNTSLDDYGPSVTADGKTMLFSRQPEGSNNHDIFMATYENGSWSDPAPFEILNSPSNDETPYISPDGTAIVFSTDREGSLRPSVTADGVARITYDIYISHKINGEWSIPVPVPGEVNTTWNERTPSLSTDKKTIYFSRWRFSNIRNSKIMFAVFTEGRYIGAVEMPYPVNTGSYEMAPTPSPGGGFYFASRRAGGFGGWDIYHVSEPLTADSRAVNLGPEINSSSNELFMSSSEKKAYFCSDRLNSFGGYDIYELTLPSAPSFQQPLSGEKTASPEKSVNDNDKANVQISLPELVMLEDSPASRPPEPQKPAEIPVQPANDADETDIKTAADGRTRIVYNLHNIGANNQADGRFLIKLYSGEEKVREITRSIVDGRVIIFPKSDVTSVEICPLDGKLIEGDTRADVVPGSIVKADIQVKSDLKGSSNWLNPVYFDFNSPKIRVSEITGLHRTIEHLRQNPEIKLRIMGHSDERGSRKANYTISLKRARAVRDYFIKMGIDPKRLTTRGYGSKRPAVKTKGLLYNDLNRRVEYKIVK